MIVQVMAISNVVLNQQIYSEETNQKRQDPTGRKVKSHFIFL